MKNTINKHRSQILIILLFSLIFSCAKTSSIDLANDQIPIDSSVDIKKNIFDLIEQIDVAEVKTLNSQNLNLNPIEKIVEYKGFFLLLTNDDEIHILDSDYRLVNTLSSKGFGPNEYREIKDFGIRSETDELYIYDFQKQRFLIYTLDLDFQRIENVALNFIEFEFLNNGNLALFTAKHQNVIDDNYLDYDLFIVDKEYNVLNKALPFQNEKFETIRLHNSKSFYKFEEGLVFNDFISDTIYKISNKSIVPLFEMKYLNKTLDDEFKKMGHSDILGKLKTDPNDFKDMDILANVCAINEDFVLSNFSNNGENIFSILNFKSRNFKNYSFPNGFNDEDHKKILKPYINSKGECFALVYPYVLEFLKKQYIDKYNDTSNLIIEKFDSILDNNISDGNQVILRFNISNF